VATDYTSARGQVRLLISDVNEGNFLIADDQIDGYLAIESGRVKRAAARALDAIATSEVLISKKIRTLDLQTDGPAVAAELRALAKQLRDEDDQDGDEGPWAVDVVPFDPLAPYRSPQGG
jgi:hypothetical protein